MNPMNPYELGMMLGQQANQNRQYAPPVMPGAQFPSTLGNSLGQGIAQGANAMFGEQSPAQRLAKLLVDRKEQYRATGQGLQGIGQSMQMGVEGVGRGLSQAVSAFTDPNQNMMQRIGNVAGGAITAGREGMWIAPNAAISAASNIDETKPLGQAMGGAIGFMDKQAQDLYGQGGKWQQSIDQLIPQGAGHDVMRGVADLMQTAGIPIVDTATRVGLMGILAKGVQAAKSGAQAGAGYFDKPISQETSSDTNFLPQRLRLRQPAYEMATQRGQDGTPQRTLPPESQFNPTKEEAMNPPSYDPNTNYQMPGANSDIPTGNHTPAETAAFDKAYMNKLRNSQSLDLTQPIGTTQLDKVMQAQASGSDQFTGGGPGAGKFDPFQVTQKGKVNGSGFESMSNNAAIRQTIQQLRDIQNATPEGDLAKLSYGDTQKLAKNLVETGSIDTRTASHLYDSIESMDLHGELDKLALSQPNSAVTSRKPKK